MNHRNIGIFLLACCVLSAGILFGMQNYIAGFWAVLSGYYSYNWMLAEDRAKQSTNQPINRKENHAD